MADCQTKVSYSTRAVLLNQNIFGLEVTVSNARFTCTRTNTTALHLHQEHAYPLYKHESPSHPECLGSPCAGVPSRWQLIAPILSSPQWWQSSDSGSQKVSHAHDSLTPARVESKCHCLKGSKLITSIKQSTLLKQQRACKTLYFEKA